MVLDSVASVHHHGLQLVGQVPVMQALEVYTKETKGMEQIHHLDLLCNLPD